ncbi:MAG: colanic acid biosynthesis glycosyltransferase WcaL [Verrucomicrobia bacterium]|nr:MAG: colanic acid biosynthesis glycosyltransferase WcaL [Verrucomicrobiota bacterium]
MVSPPRRIAIFYTTFPVRSETFVQRELLAILNQGVEVEIHSLHGGGDSFSDLPIRRFSKWRLWRLVYRLPTEWLKRPRVFFDLLHLLLGRGLHPSLLNLGENLLGMGFGIVEAPHFRKNRPDLVHGVWGSLPAMGAWLISRLCGIPFTFEAHAYDLFEHGGDWFLREKCQAADRIRTSTIAGLERLKEIGGDPARTVLIRRGLLPMPACGTRAVSDAHIRFVGVGRLVEKKGFLRQIEIFAALRAADLSFSARIIGDGPLRGAIQRAVVELDLSDRIDVTGWLPVDRVIDEIRRADFLLHTGQVARSGDRDGLPNVVGEAMAVGTVVLAAPGGGVSEAVVDGKTGFLCPLEDASSWNAAIRTVLDRPETADRIRFEARTWVERYFNADRNMKVWFEHLSGLESRGDRSNGLF